MEVCLQRIWRWERSAHPDLAKCGDTSVTYMGLLFGMSWILSLYWNKDWGQRSQKIQGTLLGYFTFKGKASFSKRFYSRFLKGNSSWTFVCCQAASCNRFKQWICLFSCFCCLLSLKSWNYPSCRHPQFLPPNQCLNKPSRDNHRSHQQLLRSILCLFSYVCFCSQPAGYPPTTSIIFQSFLFILIFSERHNQNKH